MPPSSFSPLLSGCRANSAFELLTTDCRATGAAPGSAAQLVFPPQPMTPRTLNQAENICPSLHLARLAEAFLVPSFPPSFLP